SKRDWSSDVCSSDLRRLISLEGNRFWLQVLHGPWMAVLAKDVGPAMAGRVEPSGGSDLPPVLYAKLMPSERERLDWATAGWTRRRSRGSRSELPSPSRMSRCSRRRRSGSSRLC